MAVFFNEWFEKFAFYVYYQIFQVGFLDRFLCVGYLIGISLVGIYLVGICSIGFDPIDILLVRER